MSFFLLESFVKMGKTDKIIPYIKDNWGKRMLDKGATTCWEMFDITRSYCHAWSAAPAYFLPAYILGVRPVSAGFSKIIIEPVPGKLKWAKGTIPTPKGNIFVSWKILSSGKISIKSFLPRGVKVLKCAPSRTRTGATTLKEW